MMMKALLAVFALALFSVPSASAQVDCFGFNTSVVTSGFEQVTVTVAAKTLTPTADASLAVVTLEDDDVRWRVDGTAATATVGHLLVDGSSIVVCGPQALARFSVIRDTDATANAIITVTYYKAG